MTEEQSQLIKEPVFRFFHEICQIPRPSHHEQRVKEYVMAWAKGLGLDVESDARGNVLIRKSASPGYENAPWVLLQAHMDMVCEKAHGEQHDFLKDPIEWVIDGDWITTGGKTTLGADNGIGMALAMAVLVDDTIPHPPIEVLFTTSEEDDMSGAEGVDMERIKARMLFNLDHANEREILCGSCGGMQVDMRFPVEAAAAPAGWSAYRVSVDGLKGGHSGEDIHRGRGSANILLCRALLALEACGPFRLGAIRGGSFRLAIPRDSEAVVWMAADIAEKAKSALADLEKQARGEMARTGDSVAIGFAPVDAPDWSVAPEKVLDALALCPDGVFQMNEMFDGLVDPSDNLGEIYLDENELHFVIEIRSARDSLRTYLFQRMQRLAWLLGGTCVWSNDYPSWNLQAVSPLRDICARVYEQTFGGQPVMLTVHGGLEVGYFTARCPGMDAVSIGPDCRNFHSPSEMVSIPSVRRVYGYLCSVLKEIR